MLQFYYAPLSVNARRIWIALLEKHIPFEPILLNLDGDQFSAEFTAINPLQRVPVVVDDGLRIGYRWRIPQTAKLNRVVQQ